MSLSTCKDVDSGGGSWTAQGGASEIFSYFQMQMLTGMCIEFPIRRLMRLPSGRCG